MSEKNETIEYFTMESMATETNMTTIISEKETISEEIGLIIEPNIDSKREKLEPITEEEESEKEEPSKYSQLWTDKEQIIKDLKLEDEVASVFESIALLKKYISVATENDHRYNKYILELAQDHDYIPNTAADSAASHIDAQQKAMEYAMVANKLVAKYELARLTALELVSTALSISEEQRLLAETFKNIDTNHKDKSKKIVVIKKEKKTWYQRFCRLFYYVS